MGEEIKPQGGAPLVTPQQVSTSKKPVEFTPIEFGDETEEVQVAAPVVAPKVEPVTPQVQKPVQAVQSQGGTDLVPIEFGEDELEVEEPTEPFEYKSSFKSPFRYNTAPTGLRVNPDMEVNSQPSSARISQGSLLGMSVPVLQSANTFQTQEAADVAINMAKNSPNEAKLTNQVRNNLEYTAELNKYIEEGGVVDFTKLGKYEKEKLINESEAVTPEAYRNYMQPVVVPASGNVLEKVKGISEQVNQAVNADFDNFKKIGTEFREIEKDYKKASQDIATYTKEQEEYAKIQQTKQAIDEYQGISTKLNELKASVEGSDETKSLTKSIALKDKLETELESEKKTIDELATAINAGEYSQEDYEKYRDMTSSFNTKFGRYTEALSKAKLESEKLLSKPEYKQFEELLGQIENYDIETKYKEYEDNRLALEAKVKAEAGTKQSALDKRLAEAKALYEESLPNSVLGKSKAIYGSDEAEYVESVIRTDVNAKRYALLQKEGIVGEIRSDLPPNVIEFVQSNTYLNATTKEKRYYLNKLFNSSKLPQDIASSENPKEAFFKALSPTMIPKLDAIFAKSIAKETFKKLVEAKKAVMAKATPNLDGSGYDEVTEKKLFKVNNSLDKLREVINADYEEESSWAKSFIDSWKTKVPIIGDVYEASLAFEIKKVNDFVNKNGKFIKANYDKLDEVDKALYDASALSNGYKQITNPGIKSNIGRIASESLAFMGGMGLTSAGSKAIAGTVMRTLTSVLPKAISWSPTILKGYQAAASILSKAIDPVAIARIEKIASKGVEIGAQSGLSGIGAIAKNTTERLTSNNSFFFSSDSNNYVNAVNEASDSNFFTALAKSSATQLAEVATENLSEISLFGSGALKTKLLSRGVAMSEDEIKALAANSVLSERSIRAVKSIIDNTDAGDYISRLALSDFSTWIAKRNATLGKMFNPKTYDSAAIKNFMSDAKFGSFREEFMEEFIMNRITPIIEGQEDYLYQYPLEVLGKEAKEIALGILPIYLGGGLASISAKTVAKRVAGDMGALQDFTEVVSNLSTDEFNAQMEDLNSRASSFEKKGSVDYAQAAIQERVKFENNMIEGLKEGLTYKEYNEQKKASANELREVIELKRKGDSISADAIISNQIENGASQEIRDTFSFVNDKSYDQINKSFSEMNRVEKQMQAFAMTAMGYNPALLKEKIDAIDVPPFMKKQLEAQLDMLEMEYKDNMERFGITSNQFNAPDRIEVDGFDGNKVTFTRTSSGSYAFTGVNDIEKDVSAIASGVSSMDANSMRSLVTAVRNSGLSSDEKAVISEAASAELIERLSDIDSLEEFGMGGMLDYIAAIDDTSGGKLTNEQKEEIDNRLKSMFHNSIRNAKSKEEYSDIRDLAFNLGEYADTVPLSFITSIVGSINRQLARPTKADEVSPIEFGEENEFEMEEGVEPIKPADVQQVDVSRIKVGRSRSWDAQLETAKNKESLKKIDAALDRMIDSGLISEAGKNVITSALLQSPFGVKFINIAKVRVNSELQSVEDANDFIGTRYSPKGRTITVENGYKIKDINFVSKGTESEHIREFVEEVFHNINHQVFAFIAGDANFHSTNEDIIESMFGANNNALASISTFYKSFNFDFDKFEAIKNKPENERTPDEKILYNKILDYLTFVSKEYKNKGSLMDIRFTDEFGKNFDTKKLIENYRRYDFMLKNGYSKSSALYYSKSYQEFFARVFSDIAIESALTQASKSTVDKVIDSAKGWISTKIKLPIFVRLLKSKIDKSEKTQIQALFTEAELKRINEVQSSMTEFFNTEEERLYKNLNNIMQGLLGTEGSTTPSEKFISLLDSSDYQAIEDKFLEFYSVASERYGDEAVFMYLDNVLKEVNNLSGKAAINSRSIYDYIVDRSAGNYRSSIQDYFALDEDSLFSIRGFKTGRMTRKDHAAYKMASEMFEQGKSVDEILKATDIFIGADGQPKKYVNGNITIKAHPAEYGVYTMSQLFDLDKIGRIYPQLYGMAINVSSDTDNVGEDKKNSPTPGIAPGAHFDYMGNTIKFFKGNSDLLLSKQDTDKILSTLVHEIQHAIQVMENFAYAYGDITKPANYTKAFNAIRKTANIAEDNFGPKDGSAMMLYFTAEEIESLKDIVANQEQLEKLLSKGKSGDINPAWMKVISFANYFVSANEVEARLAQTLFGLKGIDITPKNPLDFEEYEASEQIVVRAQETWAIPYTEEQNLFAKRLFHGSPYKFDKFTTDKIGTGEGVQAFGWGLYFTELEGIARHYAEKLSNLDFINYKAAKHVLDNLLEVSKNHSLDKEYYKTFENTGIAESVRKREGNLTLGEMIKRYEENVASFSDKKDRKLYKVTVHQGKTPDQYTWLEWDSPVSEEVYEKLNEVMRPKNQTGGQLYKSLSNTLGGDKNASEYLLEFGIDGIKYPAESIARGTTSDTARGFNYVVFDENAITIDDVELFAKRNPPINISGYASLIANSKGQVVTSQELYKVLGDVQLNMNKFGTKREASEFANTLVQMWKLQYLKNKMPKIGSSRLSEIVRLTKVPVRQNVSDYSKDVDFIEKYVEDVTFRKAYERAVEAKDRARKALNTRYKSDVAFFREVAKATKVNLNMFTTANELNAFAELLESKSVSMPFPQFQAKVDKYYNDWIDWKDAPTQSSATVTPAQQQINSNNLNLIGFIKAKITPTRTYTDPMVMQFLSIDENELSTEGITRYLAFLNELLVRNELTADSYKFTQKFLAEQKADEIQSSLDARFLDMLNNKVVGNAAMNWLTGIPFMHKIKGNSLGNISKYNVADFLSFAEGNKKHAGELYDTVVKPLVANEERLAGLVEELMSPMVPSKRGLTQADMVLIGIVGLLEQKPKLKVSTNSAILLNDALNTDAFKSGMELSNSSVGLMAQGYQELLKKINESLAKSIALSYGEQVEGVSAQEAERAKRITAERRNMSEAELEDEKQQALKLTGTDSILELAMSTPTLDTKQRDWLEEAKTIFKDINNGVYTDGLTLRDASVIRSSSAFTEIENYFPILRYNETEDTTEFDAGEQVLYGYSQDFYMNEGFLNTRKPVIMALNTNAWESLGRRSDQQLFYLLNVDHKKFLGQLFKTDIFNDKSDVSFSKESSSLIKEALNVIFNRGVSRAQTAMVNSKGAKKVKYAMDNIKPMLVGSVGNSIGQVATTVTAMGAMEGNPGQRLKNFIDGWKSIADYWNPSSASNQMLKKYAKEVYYRSLSDYQIPYAEEGVLIRSTLNGTYKGVYDTSDTSYINNIVRSIRNKDFRTAFQLMGLMFFDRVAARASFFSLYNNYMDNKGLPVDYENPNMEAIEFAISGVRDTQHTSSAIFQSFLSKGIIPNSDFEVKGEQGALGDLMLSSILAFKSFSVNESKFLNKQVDNISRGDDITGSTQAIVYAHLGRILFHALKYGGNILAYTAPISLAFSGDDWDEFKGRMSSYYNGMFNPAVLITKSLFDNLVLNPVAIKAAGELVERAYKGWKGVDQLEDWEKRALPYAGAEEGGLIFDLINTIERSAKVAANGLEKNTIQETYPEIAQFTILLTTLLFGSQMVPISGADAMKYLKEIERQQKLSPMPEVVPLTEPTEKKNVAKSPSKE